MTSTTTIAMFSLLFLGALISVQAVAQTDLQRCAGIEDDSIRLACYDELARPTEQSFGLPEKADPVAEATAEQIDNIVAKVTSANHSDFSGWTLSFDNGQTWKQIGTDRFSVKQGDTCTISRGSLNSFRMKCGNIERRIGVARSE